MARGSNAAKRLAWQERLRRFVSGGQVSVAQFCQQEQVSVPAFYAWRKKLAQPNETRQQADASPGVASSIARPARAQAFVPVRVTGSSTATEALEIRLPNGAELRLPSSLGTATWLPAVVAAAALAAPVDQAALAEEQASC
jgi:hypothetical protein